MGLGTIEEDFFINFIITLINFSQLNPDTDVDDLLPTMNCKSIREKIIDVSKKKFSQLMEKAHNETSMRL